MLELDQHKALAERLKQLRQTKSYSLEELAELSQVSRASISRIEKQQVSPTAQVLAKLCKALGVSLSALIVSVEDDKAAVIPYAEQVQWIDLKNGFKRRCLSPPAQGFMAEVLECELAIGSELVYDTAPAENLEHHLVLLKGNLQVTVDGLIHLLGVGDCLRYQLTSSSGFKVLGDEIVKYHLFLVRRRA